MAVRVVPAKSVSAPADPVGSFVDEFGSSLDCVDTVLPEIARLVAAVTEIAPAFPVPVVEALTRPPVICAEPPAMVILPARSTPEDSVVIELSDSTTLPLVE